ncbi:MAG: hypothetical protein AB1507_08580 [Bacillota bacterium]
MMQEFRMVTRQFVHQLFLTVQGSIQAYLAVTENLPESERVLAWQEYNEGFDQHLMPQLLEILERNNCGVAEVCHATLKLLELSARMVEMIEEAEAAQTGQEELSKALVM